MLCLVVLSGVDEIDKGDVLHDYCIQSLEVSEPPNSLPRQLQRSLLMLKALVKSNHLLLKENQNLNGSRIEKLPEPQALLEAL